MAAETKRPRRSLPEDIVFWEILACLPAKSAARFRCVSRSWNRAISSPSFIQLHLRRANRQTNGLFFASPSSEPSEDRFFYTWRPGGDGPAVERLTRNDLLHPILDTKTLHGLVLIFCQRREDQHGYYVCNPSTGALLPLPDTREPRKMNRQIHLVSQPDPPFYSQEACRLGYCSVANQYKVVRLYSDDQVNGAAPCCEVFVLGMPAYWRPTAQQPPLCTVDGEEPAVFLNGSLHFLCADGAIITLDMTHETFGSLPPAPQTNQPVIMMELDGRLCVCHGNMRAGLYRIWQLTGDGHWEQLLCVDPMALSEPELLLPAWVAPLGIYNGDDGRKKIMFGTYNCKVFTIDLHGGPPEILYRPEIAITDCFAAPGQFEESLVPMGRSIEEMVFSSPVTKAWSDVLRWLPARSVLKLSLVCRQWRALVTTDRFVRSHCVHANLTNRRPWLRFVVNDSFDSFVNVDDVGPMFMPETAHGRFECSQPCHGLNLVRCNRSEYVCNPAIGYHELIREEAGSISVGFGYNSDINDHVLVFLAYTKKNLEMGDYAIQGYVQHVQSRDWFHIERPPRPLADMQPAYVKGKIYWIVEHELGQKYSELVVFNTTMGRKFEVLQGPPCNYGSGRISVLELHGAICVACSNREANSIDVWIMRENGAWSVEYRIEFGLFLPEYTSETTTLMGINPVDGHILLSTGRSLGYYNPKTAMLEIIYTLDRPQDNHRFCVVMCQESLLLPHPH